jgi:predicted transcriptional regulator
VQNDSFIWADKPPDSRSQKRGSNAIAPVSSTRDQIFLYISEHPGTHLRQIKRELNLAMGMTQYHLYALEKERKIVSRRAGFYKRFYPNLVFGDSQHDILDVLSQETERDLLIFIIQSPESTQKDLAERVQLSPSTVSWHMKRLTDAGLVESKREGQFVKYRIKADADEILKLLKGYHPTVWEVWADRLADAMIDVSSSREISEDKKR